MNFDQSLLANKDRVHSRREIGECENKMSQFKVNELVMHFCFFPRSTSLLTATIQKDEFFFPIASLPSWQILEALEVATQMICISRRQLAMQNPEQQQGVF